MDEVSFEFCQPESIKIDFAKALSVSPWCENRVLTRGARSSTIWFFPVREGSFSEFINE
jgi:hypothetical protein